MAKAKVGFALCGSFCTFEKVLHAMERLAKLDYDITPIMSFNASGLDTKFGTARHFQDKIRDLCGKEILASIPAAEPIGPQKMFDVLLVAPCTGNTMAKLKNGITDTPVTMAVKSHLRGERPVVLALATNDALSGSAANIGALLNRRNYYFVPFGQDAPETKPRSAVAQMERIPEAVEAALQGRQLQPILV